MEAPIKLKSIGIHETRGEFIEQEIPTFDIDDFNLVIGDNAQGKTRFFNTLKFIQSIFSSSNRKKISTHFKAEFVFEIAESKNEVKYQLEIFPGTENTFSEELISGKKTFLSTSKKIVYDEVSGKNLENFFIPKNTSSVAALDDEKFPTVSLVREFFQRIVFVDAGKLNEFLLDQNANSLNSKGTNLSSVLMNWEEKHPEVFNEIKSEFKRNFNVVEDLVFIDQNLSGGLKTKVLAIVEKDLHHPVLQTALSDGMFRFLWLLCPPKTPFEFNGKKYPPSMVCVDEIENGLDYKTLKHAVKYLEDCSDDSQVMLTTHTPLIINFVHPRHWKVVKRIGPTVKFFPTAKVEEKLEEILEDYKSVNWEFYTKHISNSRLYRVK